MWKCKKCDGDCIAMSYHHGRHGCCYCHCRLTEAEVEADGKPPERP